MSHQGYLNTFLANYEMADQLLTEALSLFQNQPQQQEISLTYALSNACEWQHTEKIQSYRQQLLQVTGLRNSDFFARLEAPHRFRNHDLKPFLLRVLLKAQYALADTSIQDILLKIDTQPFLQFIKENTHHPNEGILIHWGRLIAHQEPERAKKMFLSAYALGKNLSSSALALKLVCGTAAMLAYTLCKESSAAQELIAVLQALQLDGLQPTIISQDLDGKGWFDPVLKQTTLAGQAEAYLGCMRFYLLLIKNLI